MPSYTYECGRCGGQRHEILSLAQHDEAEFFHCKKPMFQVISASQIISDIQPYRAAAVDIATGKTPHIGSRREHKEFLRRNKYHEVGTDPIKQRAPVYDDVNPRELKQTVDRIIGRKP